MLLNELNEFKSGVTYPDGYPHDRALDDLRRRAVGAQPFVLDRDATGMAASVALSKPSSIHAALNWVKLPFNTTWIEFSNSDLRQAMTDLGSPNVRPPHTQTIIERSGFLIQQKENRLVLEYIHADKTPDGRRLVDLAPVIGWYTLPDDFEKPERVSPLTGDVPNAQGRVRQHLALITNDADEFGADFDLRVRFNWAPHPDMDRVRSNVVRLMGDEKVRELEQLQANEMYRLFALQILPALILLNCRNAVDVEDVQVSAKLNKARISKGKPPLVEHKIVHMRLAPERRQASNKKPTSGTRIARGTLVMGHFKVRKSGVYWWSPHARRGYGAVTRTTILTR